VAAILHRLGAIVVTTVRGRAHPEDSHELLGLRREVAEIHVDIADHGAVQDMINTVRPEVVMHLAAKATVSVRSGDTATRRVIPTFIDKGLKTGRIPLTTRQSGRQFLGVIDGALGYILAASRLPDLPVTDDALGRPEVPTSLDVDVAVGNTAPRPKPVVLNERDGVTCLCLRPPSIHSVRRPLS